jgi:PTS system glucitol/sorbitol-specific IIC component
MDQLVWLAKGFIGIFQEGGTVLAGLITGIVPTLLVLMTAVYAFTALVGEERIVRIVAVSARPGFQYTPLRYIVAPVLAVFFLTNPMAYTQGRWFPERLKPAFYDSAVSFVHPPLGLFPHINPGEIFVWLGIAQGISLAPPKGLGLDLTPLAVRYLLVGLVVIYLRGITTEWITGWLIAREKAKLPGEPVTEPVTEPAQA